MSQALLLAFIYALFIFIDVKRMRQEGKKKPMVLYFLFMVFSVAVTMLFFFDVKMMDPQKAIVNLMKNLGVS